MDAALNKEFASCRALFSTDEEKEAFDKGMTILLEKHGVDYVRGYVAALKDMMSKRK
jgi:hypothetical protein